MAEGLSIGGERGKRGAEWVVAEPGLQKPVENGETADGEEGGEMEGERRRGKNRGGGRSRPIRNVEVGSFVMEVWVEEAKELEGKCASEEENYKDDDEDD